MSEHNITVQGGSSVRLPTAGKYCDRDIVVTAEGGGTGWDGKYQPVREDDVSIGRLSFGAIPNLKYVNIYSCKAIEARGFYGCADLKRMVINASSSKTNCACGEYAFGECGSLEYASVRGRSFGRYLFYNCKNLATAYLYHRESLVNGSSVDHPIQLPDFAFSGCEKLTSVAGYDIEFLYAESVGVGAFVDCKSLEKVEIKGCTQIGRGAFMRCLNLKAIILPGSEVCTIDFSALDETPMLTGEGHIYVPSVMYEYYRAGYEAAINELMPGFFDILFRKIEDYPEICG